MAMHAWLTLGIMSRLEDYALLAMRLVTGSFIASGVWDNLTDPKRMHEFVEFMRANGFFLPEFWGPFSVYTQLGAALLIVAGLLTRWGGLILVATFVVALWMVHWPQALREQWPTLALIIIGGVLATRGPGRFSLDQICMSRERRQ